MNDKSNNQVKSDEICKQLQEMKDEICNQLENNENKAKLFALKNSCGKTEANIVKEFYKILEWSPETAIYSGLLGWKSFKSDKYIKINNCRAIIEIKKVVENSEYGYWHGLIQSLIYRFHEDLQKKDDVIQKKKDVIFLCIVFDWGRKGGIPLDEKEKDFLSMYIDQDIYFVRFGMSGPSPFIEHNLKENQWTLIREDDKNSSCK